LVASLVEAVERCFADIPAVLVVVEVAGEDFVVGCLVTVGSRGHLVSVVTLDIDMAYALIVGVGFENCPIPIFPEAYVDPGEVVALVALDYRDYTDWTYIYPSLEYEYIR
jgi:hypothetical protein